MSEGIYDLYSYVEQIREEEQKEIEEEEARLKSKRLKKAME